MLDLPPILASFMGDAQPTKRKKNQKTVKTKQVSDVFSDTRWRYRFHWVSYRGAWIKRENPVLFSCFYSSAEPTISDPGTGWSAAAYRKKSVWSWNGVLCMMAADQPLVELLPHARKRTANPSLLFVAIKVLNVFSIYYVWRTKTHFILIVLEQ